MSETDNNRDGKNALLDELKSIRHVLDDKNTTKANRSRRNKSNKRQLIPSQIPLLQDVIDPESRDKAIQQDEIEPAHPEDLDLDLDQDQDLDLDGPEDLSTPPSIAGFTSQETDELFDLLIEEHVDEILDMLKSILRDNLALLIAHVRDADTISSNSTAEDGKDFGDDLPDLDDEDWDGNI
jgi:hypothetical protein